MDKYSKFLLCTVVSLIVLTAGACKEEIKEISKDSPVVQNSALVRFVTSKSGLRIRKKPGLDSLRLALIRYGEKVFLLEEQNDEIQIDGVPGKWSRVSYKNISGWVFGGFLSTQKEK